jgi:nucleoside-diphosphate-sugar epimerase
LPIFGRPEGFFSMVNHEDAASAVVAALKAPSGNYNVVDDEPLTRRALADALTEMLGSNRPNSARFGHTPDRECRRHGLPLAQGLEREASRGNRMGTLLSERA